MRCACHHCIYWHRNSCRLGSTSIGPLGYCEECILMDFDPETAEARRREMLAGLNPELLADEKKDAPPGCLPFPLDR